jgi:hypothetical protein
MPRGGGGGTGEQHSLPVAEKGSRLRGQGHEVTSFLKAQESMWSGPVGGMARLDAVTMASATWACQAERVTTGCGGRVALDAMLVEEDVFRMPLVQRGMLGPANRGGEGGSRGAVVADRGGSG